MHGSPSDHRLTFRRSLTAPCLAIALAVTSFNFAGEDLWDALNPRDEMQRVGGLLIRHPGVCLSWHTCRARGNGRSPQVDEAARSRGRPPRDALTRINLLHDISHDGTGLPVGSRCEDALPCRRLGVVGALPEYLVSLQIAESHLGLHESIACHDSKCDPCTLRDEVVVVNIDIHDCAGAAPGCYSCGFIDEVKSFRV